MAPKCECGCGETLPEGSTRRYKRNHSPGYKRSRARQSTGPGPLPPPSEFGPLEGGGDEDGPDEDAGVFFPGEDDVPDVAPEPEPEPVPPGPPVMDGPPQHADRQWRGTGKAKPRKIRITAAVTKDIGAKVGMLTFAVGVPWQARDPICGGRYMEQRPEITEALTEIILDSPELVEFFTGAGGAFMKYLRLLLATWPVVEMILAHHVMHSIVAGDEMPPQDLSQYAA